MQGTLFVELCIQMVLVFPVHLVCNCVDSHNVILIVTRIHRKLRTPEIRATNSLTNSNGTNRAVFFAEVADVFPVPTSGGLEVISCAVLVVLIGTTKPFIPEQAVLCILKNNCNLFAETVVTP